MMKGLLRNHGFVFLAIGSVLVNACGRVETMRPMSRNEAMATLMDLPVTQGGRTFHGRTSRLSALELQQIIEQAIASGKVRISSRTRQAVSTNGQVDLSALTQILSLVQSGQATNVFSLAKGMVAANAGSTTGTSDRLQALLGILNAVLPIIAMVAPQYAPFIQALTVIIPLVVTFIGLFRRPKPAPTTGALFIPLRSLA